MNLKQGVLTLYIGGSRMPQGKFCYVKGKPYFIANMTENKWWKNYTGYSISKKVLDAFEKVGVCPTIAYKRVDLKTYYTASRTTFLKKGILVSYDHPQYVLPIKNWEVHKGRLSEPRGFPEIKLIDWINPPKKVEPINVWGRLKEEAIKKGII